MQERERLLKGGLRRSMVFQSCPGAALAVGSSRGSDHVRLFGKPGLGRFERLHCLAFHPCGERCLTQSQPQRSAALILSVKEIKGRAVMVHGLARSSGTDRLRRRELGVGGPAYTVATVGKVEGQLGELMRILLVEAGFQETPDEAMEASLARWRDLVVEVRA